MNAVRTAVFSKDRTPPTCLWAAACTRAAPFFLFRLCYTRANINQQEDTFYMGKFRLSSSKPSFSIRVNSSSVSAGRRKNKSPLAKKKDRERRRRARAKAKAERKKAAANASPLSEEEKRERARQNIKPRLQTHCASGAQGHCF